MEYGLVSVSFRKLTPEAVLQATKQAGLTCIEWGSDVHAPCGDAQQLRKIAALQQTYGIKCCSYGTYFRLGVTPMKELPGYIAAAKTLGTDVLRLWCGNRAPEKYTPEERQELFGQCRQAAVLAEAEGVTLCMECHMTTYTETKEGALELMQAVNSRVFRMYWQPNQFRTIEENIAYASLLKPYVHHIHVFQWKGRERFPLATGVQEWQQYLQILAPQHGLLLEFMPNDDVSELPGEAETLLLLTGGSL